MCKNMFSHKMYYWYLLYLSVYILLLPFLFFLYLRGKERKEAAKEKKENTFL